MEDSLGLIKQGFIADLIILKKNPLDDIKNTMSIEIVIKNGKKYRSGNQRIPRK
jgi:imidazolonepropionase-like amidohydrolase